MGGSSLCLSLSVSQCLTVLSRGHVGTNSIRVAFCFYHLVFTINAALVADTVAAQRLTICAFFHFLSMTRAQMSAKGEAEVAVTFNPFPAVLDLSTSKAQILGSGAEQSWGSCILATGYVLFKESNLQAYP